MYQEEKDKIEEWKKIEADQNDKLKDIHVGVKQMKVHAKEIGKAIDATSKNIDKTTNMADKTEKNIQKSNKQLKEILEKVGGASNFCVDIILICVCLGLIAVLYNLIKNSTSTPSATEEVKKRLLINLN
jgi:SYP7 family syntaxin